MLFSWRSNPGAPFATLFRICETYCHSEVYCCGINDLRRWLQEADTSRHASDRQAFEMELLVAIENPAVLPYGALYAATAYPHGTDEKFLRELWADLYPYKSVPGEPYIVLKRLLHTYLHPSTGKGSADDLKAHVERNGDLEMVHFKDYLRSAALSPDGISESDYRNLMRRNETLKDFFRRMWHELYPEGE